MIKRKSRYKIKYLYNITPSYYVAQLQNCKIMNKRFRALDRTIEELTGTKSKFQNSTDKINSVVGIVKEAGLWKQSKYLCTGM